MKKWSQDARHFRQNLAVGTRASGEGNLEISEIQTLTGRQYEKLSNWQLSLTHRKIDCTPSRLTCVPVKPDDIRNKYKVHSTQLLVYSADSYRRYCT